MKYIVGLRISWRALLAAIAFSIAVPLTSIALQTWVLSPTVDTRGKWEGHLDEKGLKTGRWQYWYDNGQLMADQYYLLGWRYDIWTEWHSNGRKACEGKYVMGGRDGEWNWWWPNGQLMRRHTYAKDRRIGLGEEWYENGQQWRRATLNENWLARGSYTFWHENGIVGLVGEYEPPGKKHGVWNSRHENGEKKRLETYLHGKLNGPWIEWDENGQKRKEGHYVAGKKEGIWRSWYGYGGLLAQRPYVEDKVHGIALNWRPNGDCEAKCYLHDVEQETLAACPGQNAESSRGVEE